MTYLENNKDIIEKVVTETINEGTKYEMTVTAVYLIDGARREINLDGTPKAYIKPAEERSDLDEWMNHEKRLRGEETPKPRNIVEIWKNSGAIGFKDDPYNEPEE